MYISGDVCNARLTIAQIRHARAATSSHFGYCCMCDARLIMTSPCWLVFGSWTIDWLTHDSSIIFAL